LNKSKLKIGSVELPYGVMLAPMAGFTDRAMRIICREHGAEYTVTEMVSAKAVTYGDKKTFNLAKIGVDEGPVAIQIFGREPDVMARAAEIMSEAREGYAAPVAIDINMGCPVNKVYSNGEGSALMKSPELIEKIVRAVKGVTNLPCTVKMRVGIDESTINAVDCALAAESGGADAIAVHGRTKKQMYSGRADREIIRIVKQSLQIPLIANGDVTSADEALDMFSVTGADGIMIGRGAIGNPFLFEEVLARLKGEEYSPPTIEQRCEAALRQLSLAISDKGEGVAVKESRKQIALYISSFRGAAAIRARINRAESYGEVREALLDAALHEE
jgi:nifR3 family TIM-barrel protein